MAGFIRLEYGLVLSGSVTGGLFSGSRKTVERRQETQIYCALQLIATLNHKLGRAGLAYAAISSSGTQSISQGQESLASLSAPGGTGVSASIVSTALTAPAFICGLRQNNDDRSNVAFQNVGAAGDGSITLRVTVYNGDNGSATVLDPVSLDPGAFFQIGGVLASNGTDGWRQSVCHLRGHQRRCRPG